MLVAGLVGVVSAALPSVSPIGPGGSSPDGGSSDTHRHSATHGRTTIDAATIDARAMDATVIDAGATNADSTSAVREGVRCYRYDTGDADDRGCRNGNNASM
jgi:hypothetical protein